MSEKESIAREKSDEYPKTLADVFALAARKSILFYVPGDPDCEEVLAIELASITNDPVASHGPVLDAIEELFPDGDFPREIADLRVQLIAAQAAQNAYLGRLYSGR